MTERGIAAVIIGAGDAAERHAAAMQHVPTLRLCGFFDTDFEVSASRAWRYQCNAYRNADDAFAAARDGLVIVATPPATHGAIAARAIHSGCHVLVEKPLDVDLEWIETLSEHSQRFGLVASAVAQHRFSAGFQTLLREGRGEIDSAAVYVQRKRDGARLQDSWRSSHEVAGGGVLISIGFHYVDLLCLLLGAPVRLRDASSSCVGGIDWMTVAEADIGGIPCRIDTRWGDLPERRDRLTLRGRGRHATLEGDALPGEISPSKRQLLAAQQHDVARAIANGARPSVTVEDVAVPLRLIDEIYRKAGVRA